MTSPNTAAQALRQTPLAELHRSAGARMVDFAGWDMPVQYTGIVEEHLRVRNAVGLFDVSHMGEVDLLGPGALAAVQRLVTGDVDRLGDGQALYTVMCNERGGVVDDLIVYRVGPEHVFVCINAATTAKDMAWIRERIGAWRAAGELEPVDIVDRSDDYALIAVQGPKAEALLSKLGIAVRGVERFSFVDTELDGHPLRACRTGYTGEDGFELFIPPALAAPLWQRLLDEGQDFGVGPTGLGARDTLRLEARLHLYGNDLDDDTTPWEAGLRFVVAADKAVPGGHAFVGRDALLAQKASGIPRRLIGFVLSERGVPRHGYPIIDTESGAEVGSVTSGTWSPSLEQGIGLAFVGAEHFKSDSLAVRIRRRDVAIRRHRGPFYRRPTS